MPWQKADYEESHKQEFLQWGIREIHQVKVTALFYHTLQGYDTQTRQVYLSSSICILQILSEKALLQMSGFISTDLSLWAESRVHTLLTPQSTPVPRSHLLNCSISALIVHFKSMIQHYVH